MRLNITFIAIWGDDIVPVKKDMPSDDEEYLTVNWTGAAEETYVLIHPPSNL